MAFFTSANMDVPVIPSDVLKTAPASQKLSGSDSMEDRQMLPDSDLNTSQTPGVTLTSTDKMSSTQGLPSTVPSPVSCSLQNLVHNQNISLERATVLNSSGNVLVSDLENLKTFQGMRDTELGLSYPVSSKPCNDVASAYSLNSSSASEKAVLQLKNSAHKTELSSQLANENCGGGSGVSLCSDKTKGQEQPKPLPTTSFFMDSRIGEEV